MDNDSIRKKVQARYYKYKSEYSELKHSYEMNEEKIKNIRSHIDSIKSTVDMEYVLLSPRKVVNPEQDKLSVMEDELKDLVLQNKQIRERMELVEDELDFYQEICSNIKDSVPAHIELSDRKILEVQELERKRISQELHDSSVQNLTYLLNKTELCLKFIDIDTIRSKLELQVIYTTLKSVIDEIRNIIFDLRPMAIDDLNFKDAFQRLMINMQGHTEAIIKYDFIGEMPLMDSMNYMMIIRIIQESMNNAIKYAKAKCIYAKFEVSDKIEISIEDDGIGFTQDMKETNGYGLYIMKERTEMLKGKLDIISEIGAGTKIKAIVPLQNL